MKIGCHGIYGLIVLGLTTVASAQINYSETFHEKILTDSHWAVAGMGNLLTLTQNQVTFDSSLGNVAEYRWTNVTSTQPMGGDAQAELCIVIQQMDQWNSISFTLASMDKTWSAVISRRQNAPGEQELYWQFTRGDKKEEGTLRESAMAGTFRIVRKGTTLDLAWRTEAGEWKILKNGLIVDNSPVRAGFNFGVAKGTQSRIILKKYRQSSSQTVPEAIYPQYLSSQVLADEKTVGGIKKVYLKESQGQNQAKTILPGDFAIYGVKGPMNARGLTLRWRSSGAVKLRLIQLGTAESIQLGYTLLWDDPKGDFSKENERSVGLEEYLTRWANRKEISYTHLSSNNVFFVRFEPAGDQPITIHDLSLLGSPLKAVSPIKTNLRVTVNAEEKGRFNLLAWTSPNAKLWNDPQLRSGSQKELNGIPFRLCPTVTTPKDEPLLLQINKKAGALYLAHCSENPAKDKNWVASLQVVYDDNTTEMIFCNVGWNCGTYDTATWANCNVMMTWWGPTGHPLAAIHYLPERKYKVAWKGVYMTTVINPHPEKAIKAIILYSPKEAPKYTLLGISLTSPEKTMIGLVEPNEGAIPPNKPLVADVMVYCPDGFKDEVKGDLNVVKSATKETLGEVSLSTAGPFAFGELKVEADKKNIEPGEVKFVFASKTLPPIESSLLGWMPKALPEDKPYYLTMIAGGAEPKEDFERIRRLGYDAVKIHMGWEVEQKPGEYQWDVWRQRFELIHRQGLNVAIRNLVSWPDVPWMKGRLAPLVNVVTDKTVGFDSQDPLFAKTIVDYYSHVAAFAKNYPYVNSINANYFGLDFRCADIAASQILYGPKYAWPNFIKELSSQCNVETINAKTGLKLKAVTELTPQMLQNDPSGFLLAKYVRIMSQLLSRVQKQVVQTIRESGFKNDLVFNIQMHNQIHYLSGRGLDGYLSLGREFPPASPYHESSDRYAISFFKWMAAARTFGLPYGDEGCLTPPPYEQNLKAYQIMLMMQCKEANYCQWWNGIPGSQNIAMIKPYYQMIYNAEYLPDPVGLAFSFDSGCFEAKDSLGVNEHQPAMSHYGLANLLRGTNLNADRYVMDRFPETDKNAPPILIDDVSRYVDPAFGDRLEKYIREGGVLVASSEIDRINQGAFLKRFGITLSPIGDGRVHIIGEGVQMFVFTGSWPVEVGIKPIGKGKIVVWGRPWCQNDYDLNAPEDYLNYFRKTIASLGRFKPLVGSNVWNVDVTPYRAKDGSILTLVYNNRSESIKTIVSVNKKLLGNQENVKYIDYSAKCVEEYSPAKSMSETWQAEVELPPFQCTVLRWNGMNK
jgi:hypothetical protein